MDMDSESREGLMDMVGSDLRRISIPAKGITYRNIRYIHKHLFVEGELQ